MGRPLWNPAAEHRRLPPAGGVGRTWGGQEGWRLGASVLGGGAQQGGQRKGGERPDVLTLRPEGSGAGGVTAGVTAGDVVWEEGAIGSPRLGSQPPTSSPWPPKPGSTQLCPPTCPSGLSAWSWRLARRRCSPFLPGPPPPQAPSHSSCTPGSSPSFSWAHRVLLGAPSCLSSTYALTNNTRDHLCFFKKKRSSAL